MLAAPLPPDEAQRLEILQLSGLLDSPPEEAFDRLTRLAAQLLDVPIALVSLVDRHRQWFKSRVGLPVSETPREVSFCAHALGARQPLVVPDASVDARFADNPLVTGEPGIRFYAGVPLHSGSGVALGTLCVIDHRPRTLSERQLQQLSDLAETVSRELAQREAATLAQAVFEQAGVGIAVIGREGHWLRFNPRLPELLGHDATELIRLRPEDIVHPQDRAAYLGQLRRLLDAEIPQFRLEQRCVRRDGSSLWVSLCVTPMRSAGPPQSLVAIVEDIQARRRAEEELRASEERFRTLSTSLPVGIFLSDHQGRVTYVNPRVEELWEAPAAEILGTGWMARVHPADLPGLMDHWQEALATHRKCELGYRLQRPDGRVRHLREHSAPLRNAEGAVLGTVGTVLDVTEPRQMELALIESEHSLRLALSAGQMVAWDLDLDTGLLHERCGAPLTPAQEPSGTGLYTARIGHHTEYWTRVVPDDRPRFEAASARAREGRGDFDEEFRVVLPDEGMRWLHAKGKTVFGPDGAPQRVVGITRDVTERKRLEAELTRRAHHDTLTALENRERFRERVEQVLHARRGEAATAGSPPVVLFVDLDDFKTVNDSLGHEAGDRLLVRVAERLREAVRHGDRVARLGGDEFAILLERVRAEDEARLVAERVVDSMNLPFVLNGRQVHVGASIGIAVARAGDTPDDLLRNADLAMYRAKNGGKRRHEVFTPEMHTAALDQLVLGDELHRAVETQQFLLHYQPIFELGSGRIVGAEALLRWHHPARGLVPPGSFIPVAEDIGLIPAIGRWVLAQACRSATRWPRPAGDPLVLTVNLSARQLQESGFVDDVRQALHDSGLPPSSLALEITEGTLMQDQALMLGRLQALRQLGVRIAIDDFGTGFSSLAYLQHYPIDVLKIDKCFVDRVTKGERDAALTRTIVALADSLQLRSIAEGIESAEQEAQLQRLGCRFGQGYLFARPMEEAALQRLFSESFCSGSGRTRGEAGPALPQDRPDRSLQT